MDQNSNSGQVHENNVEDKVVHPKSKNKFDSFKDKLPSDKKRLFLLGLIVLAIPLTVALALYQQDVRSRASGYPATPATPPGEENNMHPFSVNTPNVIFSAEDFVLTLNGRTYYPGNANINWDSDGGAETTTLITRWAESDGTPMMFNILFKRSQANRNQYEIVDFAVNDGKNPPQTTIYFKGSRDWGNYGNYGYSAFWQNINLTEPNTGANLSLKNVRMFPFALYAVNPTPTKIPTPTAIDDSCTRVKPFITNIEPLDGVRKVLPGQTTFYKFWVRNDNSSFCPPTTYRVVVNIKNQYVTTQKEADFTLKSGESKDTIVNATVQKGAPLSSNPLSVALFDFNNVSKPESFVDVSLVITDVVTPQPKILNLNPNADAFVRSSAPNQNFGTSANLENDLSPDEISYLRFNLSSLAGKTIKSAKLFLNVSDATNSTLNLRRADDTSWSESGITYNNRPAFEATITSFNAKNLNSTVSLDVKNLVNSKKGTNVTFGIKSVADDSGAFYSRNAIEPKRRPQLVVEYY